VQSLSQTFIHIIDLISPFYGSFPFLIILPGKYIF